MNASQIIVLAFPVFLLLIAFEFAYGVLKSRNTYRVGDAINSIGLGALSQITALFTRLLRVGIYTAVYTHVSVLSPEAAQAFWGSWYGWVLALVFYDFCYYWLHRAGHECALFWAAHVVHHQSQDYNLSTALRQTSSGALVGWIFYVPMAVAGVPPVVFGVVALVDLLYQFWVHTEHVPKLGWFDRWFCSPSNHRVHHAVNDEYLDKNYGGVLIVWDRLFGSFKEEAAPCVYGTRSPLNSWDPLWANAEVYWALAKDSWHARHWPDKLRVWFKAPGWRPADVAARFPKPAFDSQLVRRYDPPLSGGLIFFALVEFALLLAGVASFLWVAQDLAPLHRWGWLVALVVSLWALGAAMQQRMAVSLCLATQCAALSMVTSALSWVGLHQLFKPAAMVLALFFVARYAMDAWTHSSSGRPSPVGNKSFRWLLAALFASLVGDVLLMFQGYFVWGLLAFLCAHLAYIARFTRDAPWFASRLALVLCLAYGAAMLAYLWRSLPPVLTLPVAAYVLVIALMGAQALGRAVSLQTGAARAVAAGALFFMASDSLLAVHLFVQKLPLSAFWILGSYYTAQLLIVRFVVAPVTLPGSRVKAQAA